MKKDNLIFYIEILIAVVILCYSCFDNKYLNVNINTLSLLIGLISLIIAHQSFNLSEKTINKQAEIKLFEKRTESIIQFQRLYDEIIEGRYDRARRVNTNTNEVSDTDLYAGALLTSIRVLFEKNIYDRAKEYIRLLFVFDYKNPWADGTKDERAISEFESTFKNIFEMMSEYTINNKNDSELNNRCKLLIDELHKWEELGK